MNFVYERQVILTSKGNIIEVGRRLNRLNFATDVKVLDGIVEIEYCGMCRIVVSKDFFRFHSLVRSIDVLHCKGLRHCVQ